MCLYTPLCIYKHAGSDIAENNFILHLTTASNCPEYRY